MAETKLPKCKLTGTDGNVFSIIGNVAECLEKNKLNEQAKEFRRKAFKCTSYDNVIVLAGEYVEIR